MACGWLLATLTALLAAVPLRWTNSDPLQLCNPYGDVDTLDELALCLQRFVVPEGAIPASAWREEGANFVPSPQQRHDLDKFVRKMVAAPNAQACKKLLLPASLRSVYHPPALFWDSDLGESLCLLLERTRRERFVAGWGWLAVRSAPGEEEVEAEAVEGYRDEEEEALEAGPEEMQRRQGSGGSGRRQQMERVEQGRQQGLGSSAWFRSWRRRWSWIGLQAGGPQAGEEEVGEEEAVRGGWAPRGRPLPRLHLGAPHPSFEGPVDMQAVALFRRLPSLARSVVVSGKHRRATAADSACLPGLGYPASDPSHNDDDAFNTISFALLRLEREELGHRCGPGSRSGGGGGGTAGGTGGGSSGGGGGGGEGGAVGGGSGGGGGVNKGGRRGLSVFLQLHGKARESCPTSTVFASGGFGRNATRFYGRDDTAVARLVAALEREAAVAGGGGPPPASAGSAGGGGGSAAAGWAVHLPPGDTRCALVATRNVFGRVVNGVARREACSKPADEGVGEGEGGGPAGGAREVGSDCCGGDGGEDGEEREGAGAASSSAGGSGGDGGVGGGSSGGGGGDRGCFGAFVHVEQAEEAREPAAWGVWARALRAALGGE